MVTLPPGLLRIPELGSLTRAPVNDQPTDPLLGSTLAGACRPSKHPARWLSWPPNRAR